MEQLVELGGLATQYGRLLVDHTLAEHIHSDLHHGSTCTLTVAALQHPELTVLDRELDVLHIAVVILEVVLDSIQLLVYLGHYLLERRILGYALLLRDVLSLGPTTRTLDRDLLRRADTGNHVLALSVNEVLTVEDVLTRCGVTREGYTRCRVVTHVTEYHGHNRYGRTPLGGDVVELTIQDGAIVHPRTEHGADSTPKLLPGASGEVLAGRSLHGGLERSYQLLQILYREVGILRDTALLLLLLDDLLEGVLILLRSGLHLEYYVTVHLYEAAVRVPCEPGVTAELGHSLYSLVVHTQVEDRIHHTGHRSASTRTYRQQQGLLLVTELAAGQLLDVSHGLLYLGLEQLYDCLLTLCVVLGAGVRRDRETRRYGHTDEVHLSEVCTLTTQQLTHLTITFGLFVTEGINSFYVCHKMIVLLKKY